MEIPEVCSFSDFLIWNYAEDYERAIRNALSAGRLPFGERIRNYRKAVENVYVNFTHIHRVYLHRLDDRSFRMDVIVIADLNLNFYDNTYVKEKEW